MCPLSQVGRPRQACGNSKDPTTSDCIWPATTRYGRPFIAARHRYLFEKLSLGTILDTGRKSLRHGQPLSERVFPLLANRLTRPGSEHALAQWLEDFYVCTAQGNRWMPVWKQSRRVKVEFDQLKLWYKTLDDLLTEKLRIEKEAYLGLRNLFSLKPDLAFYDITSTYFEGAGPAELGRFGYSRDGKPRNRQIVIGVVMMEGWPIAHHVFAGNRLDQTTVMEARPGSEGKIRFEPSRHPRSMIRRGRGKARFYSLRDALRFFLMVPLHKQYRTPRGDNSD